ncbi:MAG: LacI family DNA-binding transcriptional regulator [Eubacteriales bacterium]|nr:LacI family DNA-binding transcriptional regulator [Eubacteriales bacterium]
MNKQQPVRLRDLAFELNLSVSTISRAISGKGRISDKTRVRVLKAIKKSNYTPNDVARSLRMQNAMSLGIIVTDITNSFFASVIKGAQSVSREMGYSILLSNSDENILYEAEAMQLMLEKQISGLILASVGNNGPKITQFQNLNIPVVFIDNTPESVQSFDSVSTDNHKAAHSLTTRLIEKGYKHIGMITGPLNQSSGRQRYEGFQSAMKEHGIPLRDEWIREGNFQMESGRLMMRQILETPIPPKAVIICNNYMTYGAAKTIKEMGKSIPADVALASFDTDDPTSLSSPTIASMNQPAVQIGTKAAEILINRLTAKHPLSHTNLVLEPVFTDGDSW